MQALEALGTLSEDESRRLAAHLESCAACRVELDSFRGTAAALAYSVTPVSPPAELRQRILASVKAAPPVSLSVEPSRRGMEAASRAAVPSPPPPFAGYGAWQVIASRPSLMYGATAALLIIAALVVTSIALWRENRRMSGELASLSERFERSRVEVESARVSEEARGREVRELLSLPGARLAHLDGTENAPRAHASLVYNERSGQTLLLSSELPPAPEGKAYQLWYIAGGKPLPGGVFTTDGEGRATLLDKVPAEAGDAPVFAVTLEPSGGTQSPTGNKYLLGSAS